MWQNICLTNPDGILDFLDDYIERLVQVRTEIKNGDGEALTKFFSDAKAYRDTI
jgi:prephenate dehydrogenase